MKRYCIVCKDETDHRGPFIRYFFQCTKCKTITMPDLMVTEREIEEALTSILFDSQPAVLSEEHQHK